MSTQRFARHGINEHTRSISHNSSGVVGHCFQAMAGTDAVAQLPLVTDVVGNINRFNSVFDGASADPEVLQELLDHLAGLGGPLGTSKLRGGGSFRRRQRAAGVTPQRVDEEEKWGTASCDRCQPELEKGDA